MRSRDMSLSLLTTERTSLPVQDFLASVCDVPPQSIVKDGTMTRAWALRADGRPYFAKWVEERLYSDLLAKDVEICRQNLHPSIVRILSVVHTADGVLLVFAWAEGETLSDQERRQRFFRLPFAAKIKALTAIFEALATIADAGWVLVDFYEGNVLYDFATAAVTLFDFELFERGYEFVLQMDRNYGSRHLMAPEEFVRGAIIDGRSNVFTLGHYAIHALSARTDDDWRMEFQGAAALADVLARATRLERSARHESVPEFVRAFIRAV